MTQEKFFKQIKVVDLKIIEAIQDYYLCEKLVDWQEFIGKKFNFYNSVFLPMYIALNKSMLTIYTALFDKRSNYGICEILKDAQKESWVNLKFKEYCNEIDKLINKNITSKSKEEKPKTTDVAKLWRDKIVVHYDKEAIYTELYENFKQKNELDKKEMLKNFQELHICLNKIRELYDVKKIRIFSSIQTLDFMMQKLFDTENVPEKDFNYSFLYDDFS